MSESCFRMQTRDISALAAAAREEKKNWYMSNEVLGYTGNIWNYPVYDFSQAHGTTTWAGVNGKCVLQQTQIIFKVYKELKRTSWS